MIAANQRCLAQASTLLDLIDDVQYASPRGVWSPIGAQLRHVIEHYQCFLEGLPAGRIDYDSRRRDPVLEASRRRAAEAIAELAVGLGRVPANSAGRAVAVQMQCHPDHHRTNWTDSSVGRELQFLVSHSVHHFALIKLLLAGDGLTLDPEFGTAPSTVSAARAKG
jgi:hypothetical protein